jgi:molybdopterin synthase sulfur carrier subunit
VAITVRLFAALRDAAGTSQVEVEPGTLSQIVDGLCERFGEPFATRVTVASGLLDGKPVRLDEDRAVEDGAELALLPPFSGGSGASPRERRVDLVLLAGSLLVPALLALGVYSDRWAFGMVVVVVGLGSVIDFHMALGSAGLRTLLPATVPLAVGPVLLLLFGPSWAVDWMPGMIAVAVMLTFLLALASPRRHETASIVGSSLLAGSLVAAGTAALLLLYDAAPAVLLAAALALIALADAAGNLITRRSLRPRLRAMVLAPGVVAALAALVLWAVIGRPTPTLLAGFVLAAMIAAVGSARLRHMLRQPDSQAHPRPALLIGTADAVLIGVPLAFAWLQLTSLGR